MTLIKRLCLISITILTIGSISKAAVSAEMKFSNKTEMKCHVELMGGHQVIHFTVIKSSRIPNLSQFLVGRKILTDSSTKKKTIYKVKECVNAQKSFNSLTARQMEKNMAR